MTIDITTNPWHAVNHFREAAHLGPSDREAAETLWRRLRKAQKRAKRLEMVVDKANERERVLEERISELEKTLQALIDLQNGCPLPKYEPEYEQVMAKAAKLLEMRTS